MEKEIKVRKKRFTAFWLVVVLLFIQLMPVTINAAEYTVSGLSTNQVLSAGDVIQNSADACDITYYDADGTTVLSGKTIAANEAYTVSGYSGTVPVGSRFSGWKVSSVYVSGGYSGSINLIAQFTTVSYTITFDTDGGSEIAPIAAEYGTAITVPGNPTREGYTFAGWDKTIPATMPAENITITAQWTANMYTVKFVDEDGRELQSSETAYGETPAYSGAIPTGKATAQYTYTFAGWDPAITVVTGDATYTAVYTQTANKYTITFDTDGGSEIASITQDYGTAVTAPANPTKTGYTFAGWDQEIPATMPAQNLTITAQWTPYVINAGTYDMKQGVEYKLGSATKVSGDSSVYTSGSTFYVPVDGSYTFS